MPKTQIKRDRLNASCRLCGETTKLCKSHSVNNAFFRSIYRGNSGKAFVLSEDEGPVRISSESGWDFLLCQKCEGRLNRDYDQYGYRWLRSARDQVINHGWRGRFEVDPSRMGGYLASVFWRSSISSAEMYSSFETTSTMRRILLDAFEGEGGPRPFQHMTFGITALWDSHGFQSSKTLRNIIVPPSTWRAKVQGKEVVGFKMCLEGFNIFATCPKLPYGLRQKPFILSPKRKHLHLDRHDIRETPPFPELFRSTMQKLHENKLT